MTSTMLDMTEISQEEVAHRTPRQIDTELAELYAELSLVRRQRKQLMESIHLHAGDSKRFQDGKSTWQKTDGRSLIDIFDMIENGEMGAREAKRARATINQYKATGNLIHELSDKIQVLNDEYDRRPWSRYFSVMNANGHIHSSMNCNTCYPTTQYGWNPSLSGKSDKDAVDELGPALCTVCFPDAPSDWKAHPKIRAEVRLNRPAQGIFYSVKYRGFTERFRTARIAQSWYITQGAWAKNGMDKHHDERVRIMEDILDKLALEYGEDKEKLRTRLGYKINRKAKLMREAA